MYGMFKHGAVMLGTARISRPGVARLGRVGLGLVRYGFHGKAGPGWVRQGATRIP